MKLTTEIFRPENLFKKKTVLVPIFQNEKISNTTVPDVFAEQANEALKENEFTAKPGEVFILPKNGDSRAVLLGLGGVESFTRQMWSRALGKAARTLQEKNFLDFDIVMSEQLEENLSKGQALRFSSFVLHQATYQFQTYITDTERHRKPLGKSVFHVTGERKKADDDRELKEGRVTGEAAAFARTLGNVPALDMTPKRFASEAQKIAKKHQKLSVRSLGLAQIKKEKMGGLQAVASGSDQEPQFIIMEWKNAPTKNGTYVLAGKSIMFDSGGLSLKPAAKMDEMKFDMLGGSAVMGTMKAIAELGLKVNVVALLPATENLTGGSAYRPGDIIRAKNGKTIEVLNTDAEGRLVLADALSYASKYKPTLTVDVATLTGACAVALGSNYGGVFSRDEETVHALQNASQNAGEKVWPLPLDDDFVEAMKSDVADVRNISKEGPEGGASTAAAFLEQFTDYRWAHIDIAGAGWDSEKPHQNAGATGYGVALLTELAKSWQ